MREYEPRRRWTPWHVLAILFILGMLAVVLLLIYRVTDGSPAASPSGVAAVPTATVESSGLPSQTLSATQPPAATQGRGATQPARTQAPAGTQTPAKTAVPTFSPEEAGLPGFIRADAGVNCVPRRADLPAGATAAVDCRPETGPAEQVGVYLFPFEGDATTTYLDRVTAAGVPLRQDHCRDGKPGEAASFPSDGESREFEYRGEFYNFVRSGCFHNERGFANVRVLCDSAIYVGVLGHGRDLAELYRWTVDVLPDYARGDTPPSPGICYGQEGDVGIDLDPVPEP
jgi:hypothetical protein